MAVLVSSEIVEKLVVIAKSSIRARSEVARLYAHLQDIEAKMSETREFWQIGLTAAGSLESRARLKSGVSILRLCPSNVHCVALLAEFDGTLKVLAVCRRSEIERVEAALIETC